MKFESAGVIIPHDPFLLGEVELSQCLEKIAKCLKCTGFELKKISILEENERSVGSELKLFTKLYDIVVVLWNGSKQCVSESLAYITLQDVVRLPSFEGDNSTTWPVSCKLLKSNSGNSVCPVIYLQRIFIVRSDEIDKQLNFILKQHLEHYRSEAVYLKNFYVALNGSKKQLETMNNENLSITITKANGDKVEQDMVILAAKTFETVVRGEIFLKNTLGPDILLYSSWVSQMADLIYQSDDKHIQFSIEVIEKCLQDYGVDNVFLSFNGGKDCTVLLHLVQTVLQKKYPNVKGKKMFCLYVRSENSFKEQDEFIEQCMVFYNLEIMSVTANIKEALRIIINKKPNLKACFMGTRRTDPFCLHLKAFQMTDSDWPQVMRCSPFLDWHFSDIWDYLLYYKVPYCKLYDYGFTSLGNATNTIRNPSLLLADDDKEVYLPAYKMLNEKKERSGRNVCKI